MPLFVYITVPDEVCAEAIARLLVEQRLAACVNCLPGVRSFYRWEGAVACDSELVLIAKTMRDRYPALEAAVKQAHPYACPCIVALPIEQASSDFLAWIYASTKME